MTRKFNIHTLALWAALPMARTAQVESRLHMILKPNVSRRALTRRAALASLIAAALGVGTLAALRPAAQAQNEAAGSPTSWKQSLPNGATVEVLGVSDPHVFPAVWWKPDGTPLAAPPCDSDSRMRQSIVSEAIGGSTHREPQRQLAIRVTPPPGTAAGSTETIFDVKEANESGASWSQASRQGHILPNMNLVAFDLTNPEASQKDKDLPIIRCGVAVGAWVTLCARLAQEGFGITSTRPYVFQDGQDDPMHDYDHGQVVFSPVSLVGGVTAITVTHDVPYNRGQTRIVAVDLNGKVFTDDNEDDLGGIGVGNTSQATYVFKGLPLNRVKAFRFQARAYQWAEFKGIALRPKN